MKWLIAAHDNARGEDIYFGTVSSAITAERLAAELLTVIYEHHESPDDVTVAFSPVRAPTTIDDYRRGLIADELHRLTQEQIGNGE